MPQLQVVPVRNAPHHPTAVGADPMLPCEFLHDEVGARLFGRICTVAADHPRRTAVGILVRYAAEVAARIGPEARIVELGSGSAARMRILLDRLAGRAGFRVASPWTDRRGWFGVHHLEAEHEAADHDPSDGRR